MHWRRKWQPTPVFLPGESQGRGSLVGYRLWGRTESDTTEVTQQQQQQQSSWLSPTLCVLFMLLSLALICMCLLFWCKLISVHGNTSLQVTPEMNLEVTLDSFPFSSSNTGRHQFLQASVKQRSSIRRFQRTLQF